MNVNVSPRCIILNLTDISQTKGKIDWTILLSMAQCLPVPAHSLPVKDGHRQFIGVRQRLASQVKVKSLWGGNSIKSLKHQLQSSLAVLCVHTLFKQQQTKKWLVALHIKIPLLCGNQ